MDKAILLPDGTLVGDYNNILMISPVEERVEVTGGFFKKQKEVSYVYSVTVKLSDTRVEEIEFVYGNPDEAEQSRWQIINDIKIKSEENKTTQLELLFSSPSYKRYTPVVDTYLK